MASSIDSHGGEEKESHHLESQVSKGQEVKPKVHFSLLSCLGVNFSITATPVAIGTYLALSIGTGGPPFFFFDFLYAGFFQVVLCVALAELASAMPHSSGPAHWVTALGPESAADLLGYTMGWLTNACWFFISAASSLFVAQLTMAIIEATNPTYHPKTWHTYLLYCAYTLNSLAVNLPRAFKIVGWALKASVFIVNGSAVFIFVSLLVRANPKQSATSVFVDVVNETGWDSDAAVFFLSILPAVSGVGALDSATHLADEVEDAQKKIPQVMIGSALLSYFVGLPSILVYLFCNTNPDALLSPVGGQPLIQLFSDAYNSEALTIIATVCLIVIFAIAAWAALTSWSRLYWSFSRDNGFPFSKVTAKLSSSESLPLNALYVNTLLVLAIGLVELGSSTALNALLGGASLCGKISWGISVALKLWRGRDALSSDRWLNLGRFGYVVDVVSVFWSIWVCLWISFPLYIPVTPSSMNYASVVFAGVAAISVIYYFTGYKPGKRNVT